MGAFVKIYNSYLTAATQWQNSKHTNFSWLVLRVTLLLFSKFYLKKCIFVTLQFCCRLRCDIFYIWSRNVAYMLTQIFLFLFNAVSALRKIEFYVFNCRYKCICILCGIYQILPTHVLATNFLNNSNIKPMRDDSEQSFVVWMEKSKDYLSKRLF